MFLKPLRNFLLVTFPTLFVVLLLIGMWRIGRQNENGLSLPTLPSSTPDPTPIATGGTALAPSTQQLSGNIVQTPWGGLSVQATLTNGKLSAIDTPNFPDSPPSTFARPYLIRQALSSGSANIQGVSGATYTSAAFQQSLENALSKNPTL